MGFNIDKKEYILRYVWIPCVDQPLEILKRTPDHIVLLVIINIPIHSFSNLAKLHPPLAAITPKDAI